MPLSSSIGSCTVKPAPLILLLTPNNQTLPSVGSLDGAKQSKIYNPYPVVLTS